MSKWLAVGFLGLLGACVPHPVPAEAATGAGEADANSVPLLESDLVTSGALKARVSAEPADLVLFYGAEHKGSQETCGCPKRPRGSLARLQSYLDAARKETPDSPDLLLHGGYFLEDAIGLGGALREDVPVQNGWMARAIAAQDWDALNLTFNDLPGWWAMDDDAPELPVVSANLSAKNPQQDWPRWRRIDRGDLKIGVVGVSNAGVSFIATPEFVTGPIIEAATAAIQEAAKETDLLVLMAYQAPAEAKALAMQHPEIDVVIDTYKHREISKPFVVGEAIWVKADYQTQRLGELRLWIEDGEIVRALDRKIDLDPDVPDEPVMRRLMLDARKAVAAKQREVFGP